MLVRKPQHSYSHLPEPSITTLILVPIVFVIIPIHFDSQLEPGAPEIHNPISNWRLTTKPHAGAPLTKRLPQIPLGCCGVPPMLLGKHS